GKKSETGGSRRKHHHVSGLRFFLRNQQCFFHRVCYFYIFNKFGGGNFFELVQELIRRIPFQQDQVFGFFQNFLGKLREVEILVSSSRNQNNRFFKSSERRNRRIRNSRCSVIIIFHAPQFTHEL